MKKILLKIYTTTSIISFFFTLFLVIFVWASYVFTGTAKYLLVENSDRLIALVMGQLLFSVWIVPLWLNDNLENL